MCFYEDSLPGIYLYFYDSLIKTKNKEEGVYMKRKYAKVAIALAAAVTITSPGSYILGNSTTVMAAEQEQTE